MAVTGTGTQADPYIVHSYSEIKSCIENLNVGTSYGPYYITLANDINCNDYGASFEWHTIGHSNSYAYWYFDLGGHTIKNIKIAQNDTMFTFGHNGNSIIKNGKFLNVFMSGSKGFNKYSGSVYRSSKLQNISVSVNATGIAGNPFYCSFDSCSVYVEGGQSNWSIFDINDDTSPKMQAINTDFLLNNAIGYRLFADTYSNNVVGCRIRGKVTVNSSSTGLAGGTNVFSNCVVDLETNSGYMSGSETSGNTGVINTDKLPSGFSLYGMTAVNSEEIINGDSLRAKGFVVVNVSA